MIIIHLASYKGEESELDMPDIANPETQNYSILIEGVQVHLESWKLGSYYGTHMEM